MFNPKKITENLSHFEKHFYEINPHGNFVESFIDFCHLVIPLWPTYVSVVISDKNKVVTCLLGEHMKLAIAEGQEIDDQWLFKSAMSKNEIDEQSYRLHGYDFNQIISPLHDSNKSVIGAFSCFYRTNWADFASNVSNFKNEMVQAINAGMPREVIFRFLAEKIFYLVDATHVLVTERYGNTDNFFSISEFKTSGSNKIYENTKRERITNGLRIYGTVLNTAQSFIQKFVDGYPPTESPFVEDAVSTFMVSPIIFKDDIVGTLNVGFHEKTLIERTTVNMIEEIAGYVSICRMQDLGNTNLDVKNTILSETKTSFNDAEKEKVIKKATLEMVSETRESLLRSIGHIYDVFDKTTGGISIELFSPAIDSLDQLGNNLIRFQHENEKYHHSARSCVSIKAMLDELILEAEEKILRRNFGDKKINLINRLSVSGTVEINIPVIKSVFDRLIFSIIGHSRSDVNIVFESRIEPGKVIIRVSNDDPESFKFKRSVREIGRSSHTHLLFRLIQGLLRLNDIEFIINYTSETRYQLDAVFKLTEDVITPYSEKEIHEVSKPSKEKTRILIVDDDDSLRDLMVDILESRNFVVACYGEAVSAIEDFKKNKYDLVITDLSLPGLSGLELAAQLKGINHSVPVILVSGWGSEIEKIQKQNPEIDFVLPKPFNLADLLSLVEGSIKQVMQ